METSQDKKALGMFWYGIIKRRPFYNNIKVISKGKKRGYVELWYLDAGQDGLCLRSLTVHPDEIERWLC